MIALHPKLAKKVGTLLISFAYERERGRKSAE
jgi:hypothetical protein